MSEKSGAGFPQVTPECNQWMETFGPVLQNGKLPVGGNGVTSGGSLEAKYIVHCRGLMYTDIPDGPYKDKIFKNSMRMAVYTALDTAQRLGAQSVAIAPVSTNPLDMSQQFMVITTIEWATVCGPNNLKAIKICASDLETF